ncbi:nitrate-induced NOI protein [Carex littledalei]|uniref:Nitrate-induced NOI protein n=1 Tax=Carex littledalei TaxID=544730 RepID=A0A833QQP1_9POAL|nr:nitrate-induced NOI protein [Carex littledalei]
MAQSYIPPFPNSNASADTPYTQVFEKARIQRKSGGAPEPVLANPKTPPSPRHREPDPPRVTASPLHQSYLPGGKSPLHHQGSSGSGSRGSGSSRSGSSHKPVNPNYPSHPSPKPSGSRNGGNGRPHEGQIGYNTPGRQTPNRTQKKPEQYDLVPPFPSDGKETNYTEVFSRYRQDNDSSTAPSMVPYTPQHDQSPKLKRCSCFGL